MRQRRPAPPAPVVCLCDPADYARWHRDRYWHRTRRERASEFGLVGADHGPARLGYDLVAGRRWTLPRWRVVPVPRRRHDPRRWRPGAPEGGQQTWIGRY